MAPKGSQGGTTPPQAAEVRRPVADVATCPGSESDSSTASTSSTTPAAGTEKLEAETRQTLVNQTIVVDYIYIYDYLTSSESYIQIYRLSYVCVRYPFMYMQTIHLSYGIFNLEIAVKESVFVQNLVVECCLCLPLISVNRQIANI